MMPHSYLYDMYLHSYDFYCNSMQQRIFPGRSQGCPFKNVNMAVVTDSHCAGITRQDTPLIVNIYQPWLL